MDRDALQGRLDAMAHQGGFEMKVCKHKGPYAAYR